MLLDKLELCGFYLAWVLFCLVTGLSRARQCFWVAIMWMKMISYVSPEHLRWKTPVVCMCVCISRCSYSCKGRITICPQTQSSSNFPWSSVCTQHAAPLCVCLWVYSMCVLLKNHCWVDCMLCMSISCSLILDLTELLLFLSLFSPAGHLHVSVFVSTIPWR